MCKGTLAHIGEEIVQETCIDDDGMYTANCEEEEELDKWRMVMVTNASIDPGTMVVHLQHTPVYAPGSVLYCTVYSSVTNTGHICCNGAIEVPYNPDTVHSTGDAPLLICSPVSSTPSN